MSARQNRINRLADAITEYLEQEPKPEEFAKFIEHLRYKYNISVKTLLTAINILATQEIV